jgi:hypothetical protein
MMKRDVVDEGSLVAYLVDCTLATVSSMAMKKSRPVHEYSRQKGIAQYGIDKMIEMGIHPKGRSSDIIMGKISVDEWAKEHEV